MQDTQQSKRKQMTTSNNGNTERLPVTFSSIEESPKYVEAKGGFLLYCVQRHC